MKNILDFVKFGLSHANPSTVPTGAVMPYSVGDDGVWRYLYGAHGQVCTQALLDRAYTSYYEKHGMSREEFDKITKGWVENGYRVCDCNGLLDAYEGFNVNCQTTYSKYCSYKGKVDEIDRPFCFGEAVFMGTSTKKTHIGWVCGFDKNNNPLVMESRGIKYGVVITKLYGRDGDYRGLMTKLFNYGESPVQPEPSVFIFYRSLKKGMKGQDVIELKKLLIAKGYKDGITTDTSTSKNFGPATRKLVKQFQEDNGLTVDGVAGKQTITTLGGYYQ